MGLTYYSNSGNVNVYSFAKVLISNNKYLVERIKSIASLFEIDKIKKLNSLYKKSVEIIQESYPLPQYNETVDMFPWDQSYILANNLKYNPRPVFQSYTVYTEYLMKKNLEHFYSDKAPEIIFFTIKEIDGRAPFMMEGYLWPHLISLYNLDISYKDFLILKKRENKKYFRLIPIDEQTIQFGKEYLINEEGLLFAKIIVKKSLFGGLINTLYKSQIVYLEIELQDGNLEEYRIVPSLAEKGFILSPNILNINDFNKFYKGDYTFRKVKKIRLVYKDKFNISYNNNINVQLYKINFYNN